MDRRTQRDLATDSLPTWLEQLGADQNKVRSQQVMLASCRCYHRGPTSTFPGTSTRSRIYILT